MSEEIKYKSLKITEFAHSNLKKYSKENSLNMSGWVSSLIISEIDKLKKKK